MTGRVYPRLTHMFRPRQHQRDNILCQGHTPVKGATRNLSRGWKTSLSKCPAALSCESKLKLTLKFVIKSEWSSAGVWFKQWSVRSSSFTLESLWGRRSADSCSPCERVQAWVRRAPSLTCVKHQSRLRLPATFLDPVLLSSWFRYSSVPALYLCISQGNLIPAFDWIRGQTYCGVFIPMDCSSCVMCASVVLKGRWREEYNTQSTLQRRKDTSIKYRPNLRKKNKATSL